jgi:hypothetical protein
VAGPASTAASICAAGADLSAATEAGLVGAVEPQRDEIEERRVVQLAAKTVSFA